MDETVFEKAKITRYIDKQTKIYAVRDSGIDRAGETRRENRALQAFAD